MQRLPACQTETTLCVYVVVLNTQLGSHYTFNNMHDSISWAYLFNQLIKPKILYMTSVWALGSPVPHECESA